MKNGTQCAKIVLFGVALTLAFCARAEALLIGGTGSAEPLMQLLFEAFSKAHPGHRLNVVHPSLGSGGGIAALAKGKIDLAVCARPLKAEEALATGASFALASTPFVLVTHEGKRPHGFSLDELANIYQGRMQTWDDGAPIRLVLRTRDDADTSTLKSMSAAMNQAVVAADQRQGMVYGKDDQDTLDVLTRTTGSLGPSTLGFLRTTGTRLSVLPLEGIAPSIDTMKNGSYPWRRTLTIVLPLKPSPAGRQFADFMRSGKAREIMLRYDYLAASQ
jgi:phosphate transport system substrate-binding protein